MKKKKIGLIVSVVMSLIAILFCSYKLTIGAQDVKASGNLPPELSLVSNSTVQDAPTVELASAVKFTSAKTNYLGGMALDDQGYVWTWGYNAYGMLGFYDSAGGYAGGMRRVDYFVDNSIEIQSIESGYHTNYAIDKNGKVYAWGRGLEGQMGNGTTTINNPKPVIVSSLNGISIKEIHTGIEAASATYAISTDGKVYAWGYADGSRIPGASGYTSNAIEIPSLSALDIKQMDLGNQHGIVLTTDGKVYTWGAGAGGRLGQGNTTTYATPKEVTFFSDKTVEQVSANYSDNLVLVKNADETTTVYQFGEIYKTATSSTISTPEAVTFNPTSSAHGYDSVPNIRFVTAGRYVNYAVDVYGRLWSWGYNNYYQFGTDGGLQNKLNTYSSVALQQPATMGDGDTQGTTTAAYPSAPVFSGRSSAPSITYYLRYGQWTDLTDGLHPTIYDKKYNMTTEGGNLNSHQDDYLLDAQGRRVIYVIKRDANGTYSGNYYVASDSYTGAWAVRKTDTGLPAGVTEETSVPAIKQDELSWISIAAGDNPDFTGKNLKEVPNIAAISTYQSSTLVIDQSGNLYKTGLDGSGSVAWGWDYSVYEVGTAGNNATYGLYNMYTYELMFMRGVPRLSANSVQVDSPIKKIYKSQSTQNQISNVKINLGTATVSDQLNITINPKLTAAQYVILPYKAGDPNISINNPTKEQFQDAFDNAASYGYQTGDLISENQAEGNWQNLVSDSQTTGLVLEDNSHIIITDNSILWFKATTSGYSATNTTISRTVYDNYYKDTTVYHDGVNVNPPNEQIYEATNQYVAKTEDSKDSDDEDMTIYGVPLDADGEVIQVPTFGFDKVSIRAFQTGDPEYSQYIDGWYFLDSNLTPVEYGLDSKDYLIENKFVHTFNYERDPAGWVTITYKGRFVGTTTDIDPYVMDGVTGNDGIVNNQETVKKSTIGSSGVTMTLTRTPADVANAMPLNFSVDGGTAENLVNDKVVFNTISDRTISTMEVIIYYNRAELFVRQVIINSNNQVVVPSQGYFSLENTDGTDIGKRYNMTVNSGADENISFKRVQLQTETGKDYYSVSPILPEMYQYYGYRISEDEGTHSTATLEKAPEKVQIDFSAGSKYYVTIYLEPSISDSNDIPFYNWDYKLNTFGKISK